MADGFFARRPVQVGTIVVVLVVLSLTVPAVRSGLGKAVGSLRMQKVQAINVDFTPFVDANANPSLHQMVTQMISDVFDSTGAPLNRPNNGAAGVIKTTIQDPPERQIQFAIKVIW